ncbi:uncharacterized protein B0H18DRAFT_641295 [Fomitopsis serialis]|uniref:uncharacterized protein n=1 Tax=Fomitopsis serialis TaxID=139415 RepID=UPI002008257D|nr:uncharacterized protein B0H18DRAFT_641295 [Neoantrodia serialis]KAH9933320.1 hypothetical protein B0H18DRAFT_641295 [Neoantrodia serialis]
MVNVLTVDNVTEFAQNVLSQIPLPCEWSGICEAELNSWTALREHIQLHLRHLKEEADGGYRCRLPRCSCFYHATLYDLKQHIESGHLARLPISCPAAGCLMSFVHHALLPHFSAAHGDLLNIPTSILQKSGKLKRMWTSTHLHPSQLVELPSDLPLGPVPSYSIVTQLIPRSRRKGSSQAPTALQTRRKWNKMRGEGFSGEEDDNESTPFHSLHLVDATDALDFADYIVRRKPPEPVPQLSRPPCVIIPPIPSEYHLLARASAHSMTNSGS